MKIKIEESALDSLKAMVQQLQDERDMLFEACKVVVEQADYSDEYIPVWADCFDTARGAIAACTETKQVLAGK